VLQAFFFIPYVCHNRTVIQIYMVLSPPACGSCTYIPCDVNT